MKFAPILALLIPLAGPADARPLTRDLSLAEVATIVADPRFVCAVDLARGDMLANEVMADAGPPPIGAIATDDQSDTLLAAADADGDARAIAAMGWYARAASRVAEMPYRVINLTTGRDNYSVPWFGGDDLIINSGGGNDTVRTGGGRYVEVNSGIDMGDQIDHIYNETLTPGMWIGRHTLGPGGVWNEYHNYHLGAGDHSRISLVIRETTLTGDYQISPFKVPGVFQLHGPGGADTLIKSFDSRPGAQQLSFAAESADDVQIIKVRGSVRVEGDHFDFNVSEFTAVGHTDNHLTDNQRANIDFDFLAPAAQVHLDIEENTYAAKVEAVTDWFHAKGDGIGADAFIFGG